MGLRTAPDDIALRLSLASLALASVLMAGPAQAATCTVTSTNNNGGGTLRSCITGTAAGDTIAFNIGAVGSLQTINLTAALPQITKQLTIDGLTQGGAGYTGPPLIVIPGPAAGAAAGLDLQAGSTGSVIRGLCIHGFTAAAAGYGIRIQGSSNNVIAGNYLGTNPAGTAAVANRTGLYIASNGNQIDGTTTAGPNVISGNSIDGLDIDGASGGGSTNTVKGNYIGLNAAGTGALGNGYYGLAIIGGATANTIGGTAAGDRNVISGNGYVPPGLADGVSIAGLTTTGNRVQGNYIGTDKTGTPAASFPDPIANARYGVGFDSGSHDNTLGGALETLPGAGNVVAHNAVNGVWVYGASPNFSVNNAILGNKIFANKFQGIEVYQLPSGGIDSNDTLDPDPGPNGFQNHPVLSAAMSDGTNTNVAGSLNSTVGTTFRIEFFASNAASQPTSPNNYGPGERYLGFKNVTTDGSGNAVFGVSLAAGLSVGDYLTSTATVCTNPPACTTFGSTSEFGRNVQAAVGSLLVTTTANTVDGITTSISNLIANPGADGLISLREAITAANVAGGTIGFGIPLTDANHFYYPNNGVPGFAAPTTTTLADSATPASPAISNFDTDYPTGLARSWYRIRPTSALPPVSAAVVLDGTTQPGFVAGGPVILLDGSAAGASVNGLTLSASNSTIKGLVVASFSNYGIYIGPASQNDLIQGNYIGTDVSGKVATGNANDGVHSDSSAGPSTIGGTAAGAGNLISGNGQLGVSINGSANGMTLQGNLIGTDKTGLLNLGNAQSGIDLAGGNNHVVGGTSASARNVICGNGGNGILVPAGTGSTIQGNYIGVGADGATKIANSPNGIDVTGTGTLIGGTAAGAGNVISGNTQAGIFINSATGVVVQGNAIGTDATRALAVGNFDGVWVGTGTTNSLVGGTTAGAGNVIASNSGVGIATGAGAGSGNALLGNSIYSNGGLGIDLLDNGVTANDALDADTGPNDLLNFPLITSVFWSGGTLTVHIKLDVPAGSYRIEFFRNTAADVPSGYGEGKTFAGFANVTHPGGGGVFFTNYTFAGNSTDFVTATTTACTDGATCAAFGSTSEFAQDLPAHTTAVTLMSFTAVARDRAVDLSWTTASELQNLGFHLYRSLSADGPWTRITSALIPGLGSSPTGQSYSYRDSGLTNGRTYYYQLEDIETTGRTDRHGPVSATPTTGGSLPPDPVPGPSGTSYGDPSAITLREVERSPRHVVLELLTGGFVATPAEDGQVRLSIPGFESVSRPGEPELPMRRALVEAVAGRRVHLASVLASDVVRFAGLRPSSAGSPEIEVSEEGMVLPARKRTREGRAFREVYPSASARLEGVSFQEETKKAEVLLFPLRWDGEGLTLSRRLLVRLEFSGIEAGETSRGGSQGRRAVKRGSHARSGVVAQLVVKERGLYRVGYEELFATPAGRRSRGISATSLRLSRQGESVAFHVEPGATFGPGSSLYFLSEGSSLNPYADAVYELETSGRGVQMEVESLGSSSGVAGEYFQRIEREENTYYQPGLLEAPDLWVWDLVVSPGAKSFPFTVDQLALSSSAGHLSVVLQGASDFEGIVDHHVKVRVNGSLVGEVSWDGKLSQTVEGEVSAGVLREGENTLEIEDVGDTGVSYSMVFLNRFSVSYPRLLVASQGTLEGRFEASGQAVVAGGSTSSVLLDTTGVPRWLRGMQGTASGVSGVSFPVLAGKSYLLVSSFLHPEVRLLEPSTLKDATNQADYLLLAPQAFLDAAQPLLELRQSQGLATKAVSLEEVFAQFGHGETSPEAIKEFLEYAYQYWADPSPRYVLLLGDASYDPKNYLKTGVKDWLPGFPIKTGFLWTVSDPAYAAVNGEDLLPDLALGRLPAASVEEAQRLIQKVIAFEGGGGNFSGRAVLVADNADLAGNFEQDANEIASTLLAAREPRKIYYSQLGSAARANIVDAFDQGASLLSYVGHGGTVIWASENIFNYQDVAKLAPQPQQPLVMTLNCLNGFFHFPPLDSLSEALVKAEGKGAIAAFSPSGLSVNDAAHLFHKALLQEILSGRHERLGDAVLAAQKAYADSGAFPELLSIYHLFADPALRLR